jgi:hypothetical protein
MCRMIFSKYLQLTVSKALAMSIFASALGIFWRGSHWPCFCSFTMVKLQKHISLTCS